MEGEGVRRVPGPKGGTSEAPQSTLAPGTGAAAARSIRDAGCYRRRSARWCAHGHQLNWLTCLLPATQDVAAAHAKAAATSRPRRQRRAKASARRIALTNAHFNAQAGGRARVEAYS